jgi:hypothetical protein
VTIVDPMHLAHLACLCGWGAVLLIELVVESIGDDHAAWARAATLHFWIDVFAEIPLVIGILVTGGVLLLRSWPPSGLLSIKIVSAAVAIAANLYCCVVVVLRYRLRHDPAAVRRFRRRVQLSVLGVPFGAVAAYIGLAYFT